MNQFAPLAPARFIQQFLANASEWTLDDPSSVVASKADGSGYTDFSTNAVAAAFCVTRPLEDFAMSPVDEANQIFTLFSLIKPISWWSNPDELIFGTAESATPLTSGSNYEGAGARIQSATTLNAYVEDESGGTAGGTFTADRVLGTMDYHIGRNAQLIYAYAYNGTTYQAPRANNVGRPYTPTHLMVLIRQANVAAATLRVGAGCYLSDPIPDIEIAARA